MDLILPIAKLFGLTKEQLYAQWTPGCYGIHEGLKMKKDDVWKKIAKQPDNFWSDMEAYPWAKHLYMECSKVAPTYFLTSPIRSPACLAGKLEWLYRFTGHEATNFIMTEHKYLCARYDRVLIDDKEKNCSDFVLYGGKTILFPARWNRLYQFADSPCEHVDGIIPKK